MEQENLHSLREQVARQAQLRSRERSLKSQLPAPKARVEELAAARSKEQTDVDKLEGGSLKAYFLRFTGGLEDRLDQERAEAAQAKTTQTESGYTVTGEGDPAIDALVMQRYEAKKAKNFAEADRIRDELKAQGIEIVDTKDGASWKRV